MKILVSGSRGFIGSALVPSLIEQRHQVSRLIRAPATASSPDVRWDPATGVLTPVSLEGCEAVIHLAGENIAAKRWTLRHKAAILISRAHATTQLCETIAHWPQPPRVLVCASATGYYGSRGEELLTEHSPRGDGFLADVCAAWEAAADAVRQRGIRVVQLRFGMVLHPSGGALAKMLPPFRLGLGGPIGNGRQYWSWIAREDVIGAIHHVLAHETLRGPVNAVSPQPVTCREFARALGRAVGHPARLPMPTFAARLVFGEMADALLLASARVQPTALLASGYAFRFPELALALRTLLSR